MTPVPGAASADQNARTRIRESLDESMLVEASAGTGKTTELIHRIVNTLRHGHAKIEKLVAVTFTNKAAGELKLRLRQGLDRTRAKSRDQAEMSNLVDALARLEEASVGTIHSFCAQILRERPVEARVDPGFTEMTDVEARRLYAQVFRRWLERKLNEDSPALRRAMARLAAREERDYDHTPVEQLQFAGWQLIEWRDFPTPWQRTPISREEVIDPLCEAISALGKKLSHFRSDSAEPVRDILPWIERTPRDYDMLEALLFRMWRQWKWLKRPPDQTIFDCIANFRRAAEADLAAQLREEMWELIDLYDQAKRRAGKLDFLDLLLLVRNLVRDNGEVRAYLQRKFDRLFIDEFQDTDPLQAEILLLLSADDPSETDWLRATPKPGKLFVVGDPKQSIYKFRRADVHLYQTIRERLEQRGVGIVRLSKSFRSLQTIQDCVNAAFVDEMTGDRGEAQADYAPLEEDRADIEGQPAVVALPAPRPYNIRNVTKKAIDDCLPAAITGYIEWLLRQSNWRIFDVETRRLVPVRARDICILFRRFTNYGQDLTRDYVRGLEDRGIPHLLVGSKTFHWREEIETMRAALTAVEWPEDELAVYATLRGELFAINDAVLLRYRQEIGRLHPFRDPPPDVPAAFEPVMATLALLKELHLSRNRRPLAQTVYQLLESARAWAVFALRPAGHQALANARRVIDLARQFEVSGGISFRGFVEELTAQAERAESAEAPVLEEGADGVRIMTVHTAKGLEFPVVILADMTANLAHEAPDRHVDSRRGLCAMRLLGCSPMELIENEVIERRRERAEGVRVAYVAATRGRDLLVVPVVGDEEREGWLEPLNKAMYPPMMHQRESQPAPGCPAFGNDSVMARPPEYHPETGVRPGLHRARTGGHPVVWWDPHLIPQSQEEQFGQRQEEILQDYPPAVTESLEEHGQWLAKRSAALAEGARPAIGLITATEAEEPPAGYECEIRLESTIHQPGRPGGKRFGALLHNVLRDIPLDARREQIEASAKLQGRMLASPKDEVAAASRAVENALRHPLLERARRASRLHREYPVVLHLHGGRAVEGVIDLAFEEELRWVVVDFKSDGDIESRMESYRAQVAWYALALETIKAKPVECVLLHV